MSLALLMISTVGVPLLAMILFGILESMAAPGIWHQMKRVGHDLCILSVGIAGSMFANSGFVGHITPLAAAVTSIVVVLVNLILAAVAILVDFRSRCAEWRKGCLSVFLGVIAVAIPSGMIIYVVRLS